MQTKSVRANTIHDRPVVVIKLFNEGDASIGETTIAVHLCFPGSFTPRARSHCDCWLYLLWWWLRNDQTTTTKKPNQFNMYVPRAPFAIYVLTVGWTNEWMRKKIYGTTNQMSSTLINICSAELPPWIVACAEIISTPHSLYTTYNKHFFLSIIFNFNHTGNFLIRLFKSWSYGWLFTARSMCSIFAVLHDK